MKARFILNTAAKTLFILLLLSPAQRMLAQQNLVWAQKMGDNGYDKICDVAFDASGNIYTLGRFENTMDFDPGPGVFNLTSNGLSDMFITRFDAAGNFVWARGFGGNGWDIGTSLKIDASGNIYACGSFNGMANFYNGSPTSVNLTSNGMEDMFVLKLDANGVITWAKSIGGTGQDYMNTMAFDAAGNLFMTGSFNYTADFDPGPGTMNLVSAGGWDIFICSMDASGNMLWANRLGGPGFDSGWGIALDATGNIYATGSFVDTVDFDPGISVLNLMSAGSDDIFILKLDPWGQMMWARRQGGSNWDQGSSISVDGSGNVYVASKFMDTIDVDPGAAVNQVMSNGLIDYCVSKLDASGNFVWAKQIGGTGDDFGEAMLDSGGNIFLYGKFNNTVDLDPGAGTYTVSSPSAEGFFMTELNPTGNFVCGGAVTGSGDVEAVLRVQGSNLFAGGGFKNVVDFDPGSGQDTATSSGSMDAFLSKLSSCLAASAAEESSSAVNVSVYPNPTAGKIRVSGKESFTEIKVYNILGDEILSRTSRNSSEDVDLSNQPKGVYFVNISGGNKKENIIKRVIVQ